MCVVEFQSLKGVGTPTMKAPATNFQSLLLSQCFLQFAKLGKSGTDVFAQKVSDDTFNSEVCYRCD